MINYSTIETELLTLVGFNPTSLIPLTTSLITSDSGLIVNSLPDVRLELVKDASIEILEETLTSGHLTVGNWFEITDISGGADFVAVGASANTVGLRFEATATTPTWGAGSLKTLPVVDYLNNVRTEETQNILKQFVAKLQSKLRIQEVKVNDKLVKQFATETVSQNESARGFYFKMANSNTLKMVLKSVSLHLDSIDTCRLYLYEVGKTEAIRTFDYTSLENQINFEAVTDWITNFQDSTNIGKEYMLLYYDYDIDNVQTTIQLESDTKYYQNNRCFKSIHNNYVYFTPIEIPKEKWVWNGDKYDIPDLENTTALSFSTSNDNGLNLDFNVTCDITQVLIDNKAILARMVQYAYAERILNDAHTSTRSNRTKRNSNEEAVNYASKYHVKLHGETVGTNVGMQYVKGELERVVMNFANIDNKCFKSNTNKKILISNSYQK